MMGRKNGTWGELSRSIQMVRRTALDRSDSLRSSSLRISVQASTVAIGCFTPQLTLTAMEAPSHRRGGNAHPDNSRHYFHNMCLCRRQESRGHRERKYEFTPALLNPEKCT